jgi:hypothetical protein
MVAMADSQPPDLDNCFHCPQGDKPCADTYQPGAWLAQQTAEPAPTGQDRPRRSGDFDTSIQQALRKLYEAMAGDPRRPGRPVG